MTNITGDAATFREQGNQAFKQGHYQEAIDRYTDAIHALNNEQLNDSIKNDLTKCYSNRAQCNINLEQYDDAIEDATKALEYTPTDQKSLYRRANAFERSGKLNQAISDAQRLMAVSSKGGSIDEQTYNLLRRLRETAQSKVSQQTQLNSKVQQMFETVISKSNQQETALNNILVISRESSGADAILAYDTDLKHLMEFIQRDDRTCILGALRIFAEIAKNSYKRAEIVYNTLGLKPISRCFAMNHAEIPTSASILVHNMLMSICDLENRRKVRKPVNVPYNFDPLDDEDRKKINEYLEENRIICDKIINVKSFTETFKQLCASEDDAIQYRALYVIRNLVRTNKEIAMGIVQTDLMDVLFAIKEIKEDGSTNEKNRKLLSDIIQQCLSYGLIQPNKDHTIIEEDENADFD
ncbi:unnamed protein product [Rotaria magnacalcarata]|uniref:Uncharacterized protein n=2 Tax=Rotaria magnacalcarata TaxID=392030 RepID=A0A814NGK8_9BILA|nr:unnamed protein product [Rotaria magnacalcarata]